MRTPLLVGAGFLCNALLGPICMASSMDATPVQNVHAMHGMHDMHQGMPQPQDDCADHCLTQAKSVSVSLGNFFLILPPAGLPPISYASRNPVLTQSAPVPVAASPPASGRSTTVLLL